MTEANAQTQIIERDLSKLGERFDRHLEIYAQNGKELAGLKAAVENLSHTMERMNNTTVQDQANQWAKIDANDKAVRALEINVSQLAIKVGLYATIGSTAASAAVVFLLERILI